MFQTALRIQVTFALLFHFAVSGAQDIILKNPENRIIQEYLDTSISINKGRVKIKIGPDHKLAQNTIFINGPFDLNHVQVDAFKFKGSFLRHLVIDDADFNERKVFVDSTDFDSLFITNSRFNDTVVFRNVYINNLHFIFNVYPACMLFENCTIPNMSMRESNITGIISFTNCTLGNIDLKGAGFFKGINFSGSTISGTLNFDSCLFIAGKLDISHLHLLPDAKISFLSAAVPDTLDISGNKFVPDTIDLSLFRGDSTSRRGKILLQGTDLSKLKLGYSFFKLAFPRGLRADEKEKTYTDLLANFKNYGYQSSYKTLDIEYKRYQARQGTFGFLWWVPDWWWQYGYDRGRVFKIAFWALILLTLANYILLNYLPSKVYSVGTIPVYYPKRISWKRLWFAFVYTSIIFFSLSLKIDKIHFSRKAGSFYLMVIFVFGIICLAYMANYLIQR